MIITQQNFGMPDIKRISIKVVKHDLVQLYTTTIKMELNDGQTQVVSVSCDNLEALVPTIEVCPICNIELHEKDLVAMGSSYPMANDDVDALPF